MPHSVALILPPRERFSPDGAGAVAMVADRLARASSWTTHVVGRAVERPFDNFVPVESYPLGAARAVRRLRPDVVEVHNRPGLARALAWWHPCVSLVLHNDPRAMPGLRTERARERYGRSVAIAAVSEWVAARAETATVLPNGFDAPAPPTHRDPLILFAGRIVADKGADVFADAMARVLPDALGWRAVMVGADRFGPGSPDTPFLRALRPGAVEMLGWRPHADVLALLRTAAIAVVPSVWPEPFGLTALEAMASGAALVHTGAGGLPEVVGDAGFWVPPGNASALAEAVLALTQDPKRRETLATAGLVQAAKFGMAAAAARYDAWRAELLRGLPARHRRPIWRVIG